MTGSVENVVLVTVDSLRRDAVAPYADRHTPTFARLAERGTAFDHAFATGNWTPFSFPSILASRPPFVDTGRIGVDGVRTLATHLSEAGYATAGFNAANGFLTDHWGYDAGFDEFDAFVASVGSSVYSRYLATHPTVEAWLQLAASPFRRAASWLRGASDERAFLDTSRGLDVESAATAFLEDRDEPFFLWLHYMDPHTPYVPAPRYVREVSGGRLGTHRMLTAHARTGLGWEVGDRTLADLRTLYQAAVRQTDASLGRVLDTLRETGLRGDTAVVVAGDHGEEFQEHGHLAHYPKLYDELINVPLLVDAPGVTDAGGRRQGAVGLDAVPPTVCELLGVDPAPDWSGRSLVSALDAGERAASETAAGETAAGDVATNGASVGTETDDAPVVGDGEPVVSVTVRGESVTSQPIPRGLDDGDLLVSARTADWTLVDDGDDRELYHRPSDPTQQRDLNAVSDDAGSPEPDEATLSTLRGAVRERRRELERVSASEAGAADEDLEARLTALGYK